jgi:hypothetical protein
MSGTFVLINVSVYIFSRDLIKFIVHKVIKITKRVT